ncbi:erythromycin esterase family protein [Streptomyces sp. NPDC048295]|uniref:erythromycin esterase family protein n=1 Tax=Streptomyces sp. NPDC048295 TaxID=3154617 RepID=UPI00341F16F6
MNTHREAPGRPLGKAVSPSDVTRLREIVGDARVVALGEGGHNITEFYGLRDRLFRYLVRECGFTGLVLESGFAEGLGVDAWVHGGPGRVQDVSRTGITYRFGECEPMRRQLRWMRRHNTTGEGTVSFYGMDLPGSSTSPLSAVRACLDRLPAQPGDAALLALSDLGERSRAAVRYAAMDSAERARLLDSMQRLAHRARRHGSGVLARCGASLEAFAAELTGTPPPELPYPREEFMARSVRWVLEREARVVVSAHNSHVRRTPFHGRPTLGSLLSPTLGADLVVVGMTYGSGPEVRFTQRSPRPFDCDVTLGRRVLVPASVESRLEHLGPRAALLTTCDAPPGFFDGVHGTLAGGGLDPVDDFPAAYDALLHFRRVSRTPGAFERTRAEFADARSAQHEETSR